MAMSMRMLWNIGGNLLSSGKSMKSGCTHTTMTGNSIMNSLAFLSHLVNDSVSSWSPMMNQHFMRMTAAKLHGGTNRTSQSHWKRGRVHRLWHQIFDCGMGEITECRWNLVRESLTSWYFGLNNLIRSACIVSKAGKNCDGYFTCDDLIEQVDKAIDIFEERTNGFVTGLFIFDNAPSHQKWADDALSARKMPKNPSSGWVHRKGGARMRNVTLPNGQQQNLYFDHDHPTMPSWFKGMEVIIWERGPWPEKGHLAQCESFRCKNGCIDCCCWHLFFCQPDFMTQKSRLEEFVTLCWHICDFYPKYHCELNFIE